MFIIVATNVVASQPPERRLAGTPTAHANKGAINIIDTQLPKLQQTAKPTAHVNF